MGSWTTAPGPIEGVALGGQTIRVIARVSIGGRTVRVRLSNTYGNRPLPIGAAHIALCGDGPDTIPGSDRTLTFNGSPAAEISTGALLVSDPVDLDIPPLTDLAVSVYIPGEVPKVTGNNTAPRRAIFRHPAILPPPLPCRSTKRRCPGCCSTASTFWRHRIPAGSWLWVTR